MLARLTKSFHFLTCFFSYPDEVKEFVTFAEVVGPQLIKQGSVSELMKQIRQTEVVKAAVEYQGEVFADALSDRASAIIVAHNHPTGSLEPSATDVEVTGQLKAAGSVVGIALLDHIIFNRSEYFSFLESGRL
jgi:DNA repair protein RadC